jgi:hypothetical protein
MRSPNIPQFFQASWYKITHARNTEVARQKKIRERLASVVKIIVRHINSILMYYAKQIQ